MPIYNITLTIPSNTTLENAIRSEVKVAKGILETFQLLIPEGHKGLTHVELHYLGKQLLPTNTDGDFTGDGQLLIFSPNIELFETPLVLALNGYNLDDVYEHTFYAWIEIQDERGVTNIPFDAPIPVQV